MPGVLKLSREYNLGLFDAESASIWSVNISSKASQIVILDSGNFLMLSNDNDKSNSETVLQNFDNPVDTWLLGMRFDGHKTLVCWKNSLNTERCSQYFLLSYGSIRGQTIGANIEQFCTVLGDQNLGRQCFQ
ncbi:hypothetical protein SUGI_0279870 [Cryptomeria japonica]|nr:hypothetical protein SUGI_0279870 [Cryptomeria japonica]